MKAQSNAGVLGRSLLAALWGMIGGPIIWLLLTQLFGESSDAVLYALGVSLLLSLAGYGGTLLIIRVWRR